MKCTTKILIGMILSGLIVIVVGSIVIYKANPEKDLLRFNGRQKQIQVTPYRVLNVSVEAGNRLKKKNVFFDGNVSVLPTVGGQHTLSYPEGLERYFSVETKNDTMNLVFKLSESNLPENDKNEEWINLLFSEITLTADSLLRGVHSDAYRLSIHLANLQSDSIALNASSLQVDSCRFRSLFVQNTQRVELKNSQIRNVYFDLDDINVWSVDNCQIENEYLTGSGTHSNDLQKGECRHLYWKPKNEDAQIRVMLKEEASVSLLSGGEKQ